MRRFIALALLMLLAPAVFGGEGKVLKVLPQLLDKDGRHTLSPSLYERDAYQFHLRKSPSLQHGIRLAVQWKAKKVDWSKLTMRAEMRSLIDDRMKTITLDHPVAKNGWLSSWAEFIIDGDKFKGFGHLVSWRVTLYEGDKPLNAMESFLWSGVEAKK